MKTPFSVLLCLVAVLSHAQFKEMPAQEIPQGAMVELGFSPSGAALFVVLHAIQSAKATLLVTCDGLTSLPIAEALIAAAVRGVKVSIVIDNEESSDRHSLISFLEDRGITIRRNFHYSLQHDTFLVIDGASIERGSFSYGGAADQRNAENALYLINVPHIAEQYAAEWQRLWNESE